MHDDNILYTHSSPIMIIFTYIHYWVGVYIFGVNNIFLSAVRNGIPRLYYDNSIIATKT